MWYMMDHITDQDTAPESGLPDMTYLSKPRSKGYAFRMVTPEALVGSDNPLTGGPFGREIKVGLGTRRHAEALRLRDVYLVREAKSLLAERYAAVSEQQANVTSAEPRLFPEWPLKSATGKANSVSEWFRITVEGCALSA